MVDLLLELLSEEIPARMQAQAAKDLERLVVGALSDRGLLFEGAKAFAGPRRLTLAVAGLPLKQPDVSEEIKGPKTDAPQAAIDGFLKKTGVALDQLEAREVGKGKVYFATIKRAGRATAEVLAEVLPEVFAKLPWPKSMRFPGSAVRWVRPLHGIVCTLDGEVVPFEFAGVKSGDITRGHRFLSSGGIVVRRFDDYREKLAAAHVILDAEERKAVIFGNIKQAAFVHGLDLIPDESLLDEVAGLAEYPVVLIGTIEDQFMDVPAEILQTSMRTHQKYFSLRDPKTGAMANRFALVSNMVASDGGKEIVAGNERVLRARLSDAKFFWDQDRKRTLESRVDDLKQVVFHAELGWQSDRVRRIGLLALDIAERLDSDPEEAERAAHLCKADLLSGVVGEFPELQGVMGRYYALNDGEPIAVADAIRDHYKPVGPSDDIPRTGTSVAVALADKFDMLLAFFFIGEKPSGSRDPFALRRAALGAIRIILENRIRISLSDLFWKPIIHVDVDKRVYEDIRALSQTEDGLRVLGMEGEIKRIEQTIEGYVNSDEYLDQRGNLQAQIIGGLLDFLADRLKVALREKGIRHDLIDAVFSLGDEDDLVRLVARVEALQAFLKSDDGVNLLTAYRRGANILKAEEKKDKITFDGDVDPKVLVAEEEIGLFNELGHTSDRIKGDVARERFVEAMGVMARLRLPVDAFFDKVKVNDDDPAVRENRLRLLARLRATLHLVADFSKIEG